MGRLSTFPSAFLAALIVVVLEGIGVSLFFRFIILIGIIFFLLEE